MTCCATKADGRTAGGGGGGDIGGVGDIAVRIARAIDNAAHPGSGGFDAGNVNRSGSGAAGGGAGGANVIPFSMVNPFRPLLQTRAPIAGMNAFPAVRDIVNFSSRVETFNARGERDKSADGMPEGAESLGFFDPGSTIPSGIGLPQTGPSNLQLILDTIARTLPATISAAKKQPYYDPSGGAYGSGSYQAGGYANPGANVGGQVGAAVGNVGDTLGNIVAQHPYLILAGGAALVLLFMSPPRRR